ncbi:phage Gp37/Gp68 family protein [Nonomuraea sp. MG754425]|uniref:DUF5131 family protein n=1 Tax=Nonomuraea sp. MG754425 TaxID=2570319 RepID=UPI001F3AEA48|nr:phage Gp37/Gp68 family protein [Nonomuraea sp. MG754425]MCF6467315.1 phage Gp37/Gp68 family protein [Nonomuraea sp. MG754425]
MSDNSTIEWLNKPGYQPATWNPTIGCKRVSPGCDNCYPIPLARIREANPNPKIAAAFAGVVEHTGDRLDWTGQVNLLPDRLDMPLKWRQPRMVFVNSLSDLFHDAIPDQFITQVFAMMASAPQHAFQILTKRHGRMRSLLSSEVFRTEVAYWAGQMCENGDVMHDSVMFGEWPRRNIWLGVSVENQQWADIRIPALLETPVAVRWISAEPLLGPVTLCRINWIGRDPLQRNEPRLDWVVAGGESGPGARPMHPDWPRRLRDQCVKTGVPFFMKQAGAVLAKEWGCSDSKGHNPAEWPERFPREYPDA